MNKFLAKPDTHYSQTRVAHAFNTDILNMQQYLFEN